MVKIGLFKRGDTVVCVNDERSSDMLKNGEEYIVKGIITELFNTDLGELEYLYDLIGVDSFARTGFFGSRFRIVRKVNNNTKTI